MNLSNKVLAGTVLFTGTACVIDHNFSLKEGDIVEISNSMLGILNNKICLHSTEEKNYIFREEKKT